MNWVGASIAAGYFGLLALAACATWLGAHLKGPQAPGDEFVIASLTLADDGYPVSYNRGYAKGVLIFVAPPPSENFWGNSFHDLDMLYEINQDLSPEKETR